MADEGLPVIARFEVHRRSYLAPDGTVLRPLPSFTSDIGVLLSLYRGMVLTRAFDLKAVSLQRTGRLGTYAVSLGQEAVSVGIASAMRVEDVVLPSYRDNGTLLWRGTKMEEILLFWGGDERGNLSSGPAHDFPYCIPVGSQAPHAAGVAYAFKLRKEPRVAVCLFGDGATSKGDVWEAMNFAGVHKLPLVFVANNNQWAISVPLKLQTASQTLAQKAIAAGFSGEQVDGNDVIAVRAAAEDAIAQRPHDRRRRGALPPARGGSGALEGGADRAPARLSRKSKRVGQGAGGATRGRMPKADRGGDRTLFGVHAACAGDDVRPSLRRTPAHLCQPAGGAHRRLQCLR
jgi:2-oxoisovalerate dehydrogenase E1 component alpha subunit